MSNLAIIPARGGSKRIPRKNIKDFLGKPIIAYSIQTAIDSALFDEIMVSTDDAEIAQIAKQFGASVPFMRNSCTADDHATLADVIDEVKASYLKLNKQFEYICCILPTAPLITCKILKKGHSILTENEVDSVRPVIRFSYPIQRALRLNDGNVSMFYPEYQNTRSQDIEPAYHDAGQFYWMKFKTGLRGINKYGFEVLEIQAQDIDNEIDWSIAEIKYQYIQKGKL